MANKSFAGNAGTGNNPTGTKDTSANIKSNIVIFKVFTAPQANTNASSGSLKKAGKVARTSNSHITTNRKLYFNEG